MNDIFIIKPFNHVFFVCIILWIILMHFFIKNYKDADMRIKKLLIVSIYTIVLIVFILYKFSMKYDDEFAKLRIDNGYAHFNWLEELPLHLCYISIIFMIVGTLLDLKAILGFCFYIGSMGGICALLIPGIGITGYSILLPRVMGFVIFLSLTESNVKNSQNH